MNCRPCEGTGFLNIEQLPAAIQVLDAPDVLAWIQAHPEDAGDCTVCTCCGNGVDAWHGEPGRHYTADDPTGMNGPYAYNGGLAECH